MVLAGLRFLTRRHTTKIELGPGASKRAGFVGLDIVAQPGVDHVLDFERDRLPFDDDSVEEVFSSHCWEHIADPKNIIMELVRVCRHGAKIELWMPYGHSDDGFCLGHRNFYTELHWRHFTIDFPQSWQERPVSCLRWKLVRYNLRSGVRETLESMSIPIDFAVEHMNNIAWEFGIFLEVDKIGGPVSPTVREFGYGRGGTP